MCQNADTLKKLHATLIVHGLCGGADQLLSATKLLSLYGSFGLVGSARRLFDQLPSPDLYSFKVMIRWYFLNDMHSDVVSIYDLARVTLGALNEDVVFSVVLKACRELRDAVSGKRLHCHVIKASYPDSFVLTCLVDVYSKCGLVDSARHVFDEISERNVVSFDVVSWTAMIVGYAQRDHPNMALELFSSKRWEGLLPNSVTLSSVLSACAQIGDSLLGRSLHVLAVKLGCDDDHAARNALIDVYAKCGAMSDARCVFETILDKDVVSWNSIVSGSAQCGCAYEALELFQRMRLESFSPDAVTIVGVFSACSSLGALQFGSSVHAFSFKCGLMSSSVYVGTALLNFYSKCGDARSARMVFDGMEEKNAVTWGAMIGGYGMQGDGSGSLALFKDMLREEFEPNDVLFTTILAACSHSGMVGEGSRLFDMMCGELNFVPSMKHYACMVDLLARSGNLDEALDFMDKMPVQPSVGVFGAFLHGCGLHSRFDLGEVAIRRMLELHPDEACYYVLVSNLYASDGRWGMVKEVREMIKQSGLSKVPGCSSVKIGINNHQYAKVAAIA
ncbi:hypothetical protein Ahy_A03g010847 isoform A [Arachis hypogaea]|uniref:Pentatricopeptide repeat-containing protein n=1 Tax=Arachis hypogaea TaxID=3818 RepID=A0A445DNR1_ARAHY|nr:hypothetical protein Ahy_A03g010847 isoform A [Arachis hypogaea]